VYIPPVFVQKGKKTALSHIISTHTPIHDFV